MGEVLDSAVFFVRAPYLYDADRVSYDSGFSSNEESVTKQSFAEEVDINTIVRRFNLTGEMPSDIRAPQYGDFSGISDFHAALNAVAQAREEFDRIPAEVRAKFHNDPGEFVDFCVDPVNLPELRKLGLAVGESRPKDSSGSVMSASTDSGGGRVATPTSEGSKVPSDGSSKAPVR